MVVDSIRLFPPFGRNYQISFPYPQQDLILIFEKGMFTSFSHIRPLGCIMFVHGTCFAWRFAMFCSLLEMKV